MFINHVTVLVKDRKRAEEFYVGKLGLQPVPVGRSLWVAVGEQYIHLTESSGSPIAGTFQHFAIGVDNLVPYLEKLVAAGLEVFDLDSSIQPVSINENLDAPRRQYFVRDPDGNLIEFHDTKNAFFLTGKS